MTQHGALLISYNDDVKTSVIEMEDIFRCKRIYYSCILSNNKHPSRQRRRKTSNITGIQQFDHLRTVGRDDVPCKVVIIVITRFDSCNMGFGRPLEKPSVMIVRPPLHVGPTIMTSDVSAGRQNPILPSQIRLLLYCWPITAGEQ